jgi:hypothetical protein
LSTIETYDRPLDEAATSGWQLRLRRVEEIAERWLSSRVLVLLLFTAAYAASSAYLASIKLLWDDEFFTLYIAKAPGWSGILAALSTGADQHPPSFYIIVQALTNAFGVGHITLRLAAIAGYWLFCVCSYEIASRLTNRVWGTLALLLPLSSPAVYYATEARGYGMALGFTALAFLSWLLACDGTRRFLTVPLIAFSLAMAVGSHYYAGLIVLPLMLGELIRSYSRRKLDLPVVASLGGVMLPILAFLPIIRKARGYSQHFWAPTARKDVFEFLPAFDTYWLSIVFAGIIVLLVLSSARTAREYRETRLPLWQTAAFSVLALLPVMYVIVGRLVTKAYTPRYALPALIGFIILFCVGLAKMARSRTAVALTMILAACGFSTLEVVKLQSTNSSARGDIAAHVQFMKQFPDPIIVVGDVTLFHRLSFYASREIARRLVYPADPQLSIRYEGHDTIDRGLLDLNPWFPINVVPFRDFLLNNASFGVYTYVGVWSWITYELPEVAKDVRLLKRRDYDVFFHVEEVDPEQAVQRTSGYKGNTNPPLYLQQASTGPSLCSQWMGETSCPALR